MTNEQALWILAAQHIGADPEDHEDDESIRPVFEELKALYEEWKGQSDA